MRSRHGSLMKAGRLKESLLTVIDFINVTLLSSQLGQLSFGHSDESPVVLNNTMMMFPNSPLLLSRWQPAVAQGTLKKNKKLHRSTSSDGSAKWGVQINLDCIILQLV